MLLKSLKYDLFKAAEALLLDPLMDIYGTSHKVKNEWHGYSHILNVYKYRRRKYRSV